MVQIICDYSAAIRYSERNNGVYCCSIYRIRYIRIRPIADIGNKGYFKAFLSSKLVSLLNILTYEHDIRNLVSIRKVLGLEWY